MTLLVSVVLFLKSLPTAHAIQNTINKFNKLKKKIKIEEHYGIYNIFIFYEVDAKLSWNS